MHIFPTQRLNFIDVATGSLGQGLSCACGMAYTGKYFDKARFVLNVFCIFKNSHLFSSSFEVGWQDFFNANLGLLCMPRLSMGPLV